MSEKRAHTWVTVIAVVVGAVCAAALGVYSFLNAVSTPLHPNREEVPSVVEAPPSPAWAEAISRGREEARAGLVEHNLPGLSVAVGVNDEIVWAEGFGWADVEKRVPVAPRMRFRIGHASKALTSAAVGVLLERGRLRLDDDIRTYAPAFPEKEWPVTLRQLMGHTAGVRHYEPTDHMPLSGCARASEGLPMFAEHPLLFEPDTQYRYSTYGWILVSAAVEAAAGEPFIGFMRRQVFEPLGMTATTLDAGTTAMADRVTFYYPRFSGDPSTGPDPAASVDYSCFAGASGLLSTPADLVRFGNALGAGRLLKRSTVLQLQMPQVLASGTETAYGLGWMLQNVALAGGPTPSAGHSSLTPLGGSTAFLTFPERGIVVAVTTNVSRAPTRSIALRIAEVFAVR